MSVREHFVRTESVTTPSLALESGSESLELEMNSGTPPASSQRATATGVESGKNSLGRTQLTYMYIVMSLHITLHPLPPFLPCSLPPSLPAGSVYYVVRAVQSDTVCVVHASQLHCGSEDGGSELVIGAQCQMKGEGGVTTPVVVIGVGQLGTREP